ncbi:MAG: Fic family protein [Archangium sp.]|nr:Fic family protein [Archangium sp.]
MAPTFVLTPRGLRSLTQIERLLGRCDGLDVAQPQPLLRKKNQVRSVRASAAIEGNTLSEEQVTALLEGRRVIGERKEITEILNVNTAYERLPNWRAASRTSLCSAHGVLMKGLTADAGRLRTSSVGVFRGKKLAHLAPPAHLVFDHVTRLLRWTTRSDAPRIVTAVVTHYELLFIHPFLDGNGRLSRLWQQVVQAPHHAVLRYVPIESIIRERQRGYYDALRASDRSGGATPFLDFTLSAMVAALEQFVSEVRPDVPNVESRVEASRKKLGRRWFSRLDYLALHPRISTATASRDLATALSDRTLEARGARRLTQYRFR